MHLIAGQWSSSKQVKCREEQQWFSLDKISSLCALNFFFFPSQRPWVSFEIRKNLQDGEHMYTCGGFILMFGKTNTIM